MGGFVKGIGVGLASFALGFVVLSVAVPVDPGPAASAGEEPVELIGAAPEAADPAPAIPQAAPAQEEAVPAPPSTPAMPAATGSEAPERMQALTAMPTEASPPPAPPIDTATEAQATLSAVTPVTTPAAPEAPAMPGSDGAPAATLAAPTGMAVAPSASPTPPADTPSDPNAALAALAPVATPPAPEAPAMPGSDGAPAATLAAPAGMAVSSSASPTPPADTPSDPNARLAALAPVAMPPAPEAPVLPGADGAAAPAMTAPQLPAAEAGLPAAPPADSPSDSAALARIVPVAPVTATALPAGEPLLTGPDAGAAEADVTIAAPEVEAPADETPAAPEAEATPTRRLPPVAQEETLALVPPVPEPSAPQEPAAPGLPAPVIAPAVPRGEPLLPGAVPERPPVSTLPGQVAGVIVGRGTLGDDSAVRRGGVQMAGRLPTIGESAAEAPTAASAVAPDARPAVERFAAQPALGADQVPLGVVLIDEPAAETAILALPVPVTVALDPYDPEAPRRAAAYRAVGHEIALQAMRVPQLATPSDLETLIDGWHRAFPEAMAVIDVPVNGLGANPALARNVAAMLASEGYGAIALRDGLDAFLQASRGAGLRAASVYRVIESDDQSEFTIRRLIDRAAFEALRQPAVVIVAAASDRDTMRELTDFAEGAGRAGVGLAPVSAVLNRN